MEEISLVKSDRLSWRRPKLPLAGLIVLAASVPLALSAFGAKSTTGSLLRSAGPERRLEDAAAAPACDASCCETICSQGEDGFVGVLPLFVQILLIMVLICLSALFSGLTLGLMSLDKTGLEIVMEGDDPKSAEAARKIYPVRKNGNLLLCTLLLGNTAVNALLSILLAANAGGIVGFFTSTFLILIFGEIVPQAVCSRHALLIGSTVIPIVRVIVVILYPAAAPLAYVLDKVLGEELATTYSSSEMLKLLQIHVQEEVIDKETAVAMEGALKYKDIAVKEVMTPLVHTFMLNVDERLSFETIATIFKTGYSRIPVYEVSKNNVIGLLFVKDLIFIDPEDETPLRQFVQIFGRGVHVVWPDDNLGDVLRELKRGRSHMALVRDVNNDDDTQDPFYEIKGIITLEDIIEEIIGDQIVDETDAFVDGTHSEKVNRQAFEWARLRLLDSKIVDETLSDDETKAVTAHLRANHSKTVSLLTDKQLHRLVGDKSVTEMPTAVQEIGSDIPGDLLYERGVSSDICTLILSGKVTVLAGEDSFRSDVSSWAVLGASALSNPLYKPDFSAFVSSGPCRCLRFTRDEFAAAVDASALEKRAALDHSIHTDPGDALDSAPERLSLNNASPVRGDHETRRLDGRSRRTKLLAALQGAGTPQDQRKDESESAAKDSSSAASVSYQGSGRRSSSVAFVDQESDLNEVLSEGGAYQPKS